MKLILSNFYSQDGVPEMWCRFRDCPPCHEKDEQLPPTMGQKSDMAGVFSGWDALKKQALTRFCSKKGRELGESDPDQNSTFSPVHRNGKILNV